MGRRNSKNTNVQNLGPVTLSVFLFALLKKSLHECNRSAGTLHIFVKLDQTSEGLVCCLQAGRLFWQVTEPGLFFSSRKLGVRDN